MNMKLTRRTFIKGVGAAAIAICVPNVFAQRQPGIYMRIPNHEMPKVLAYIKRFYPMLFYSLNQGSCVRQGECSWLKLSAKSDILTRRLVPVGPIEAAYAADLIIYDVPGLHVVHKDRTAVFDFNRALSQVPAHLIEQRVS